MFRQDQGKTKEMVKCSWVSQGAIITLDPKGKEEAIVTGTGRAVIVEEGHTMIERVLTTCSLAKRKLLE